MAKCVYCEAETTLYEAGTPLCVGCSDRLEAGERLTRKGSSSSPAEPELKTMKAQNGK